jgi:hypothetical protein
MLQYQCYLISSLKVISGLKGPIAVHMHVYTMAQGKLVWSALHIFHGLISDCFDKLVQLLSNHFFVMCCQHGKINLSMTL